MDEVLALTIELCRRPSVTPDDAGCQDLLAERLAARGFAIERLDRGAVRNLWATHGSGGPVLVYLGHTDVVPSRAGVGMGHAALRADAVATGMLYARGAADMKGSVAAMTLALERFVAAHPRHPGTLALLLTSDEEGDAIDGIRHVAQALRARGQRIDWCLVGEPSSARSLGDQIRIGRRGSLTGYATVHGVQGHVAYPELARNPIHALAPALAELVARRWDEGTPRVSRHQLPGRQCPRRHRRQQRGAGRAAAWTSTSATARPGPPPSSRPRWKPASRDTASSIRCAGTCRASPS